MIGLRWTIGVLTAAAALGTVALAVVGGGFRRSFGASDNSTAIIAGVVIFASLTLASVVWPERRTLMHVVALLMLALLVTCATRAPTLFIATVGILYAAAWLVLYYRAVWQR
jgi:hypothetical protein